MATPMTTRALVAYEPKDGQPSLKLEEITLNRAVGEDEVLVRMVATGICHTDLVFAMAPAEALGPYPKVLGHEGAGYVEEVGARVLSVKKGDPVLCSFSFCSKCTDCRTGHPSFCRSFELLNYAGTPSLYSSSMGQFFGQSSFSNLSIVRESSLVNVKGLVESKEDLCLFSPMGCGFQTGAGTVENLCKAGPNDTVVVLGLGGVGIAAIMAAKIVGARVVVGIDRVASRLELAKSMGATHTVDTAHPDTPMDKLVEVVKGLTDGDGATIAVDTTGFMPLITAAVGFIGNRGQLVLLGVPPPESELALHVISTIQSGKVVRGSIEGDVTPVTYVPKMIEWFRKGMLPIDRLVGTYPVEDYAQALADMHSGKTIKPVLVW